MTEHKRGALQEIGSNAAAFSATFIAVFCLLFLFLAFVGATPEKPGVSGVATSTPLATNTPTTPASPSDPVRVVAADINLDTTVANPTTTNLAALDVLLLKGAVRYPSSAPLGVEGTMLIFGHSSYLPVVRNQAYKTFDGIQDLKTGQIISVYSSTREYRYKVVGVRVANAENDSIELVATGQHLVLVTCDTFASKSHRFVVTADLFESRPQ